MSRVCVGAIVGGFGVRGEARIKSFCANPRDIQRYSPLSDERGKVLTLTALREINEGFAAKFTEIHTKEDADQLKGTRLYADRAKFPMLEEDEYYHSDLISLMVFDGHGREIGKVKSIQNFGAGDLLEIHYQHKSVLIPFTRSNVPLVDIDSGKVIIDPPDGILE